MKKYEQKDPEILRETVESTCRYLDSLYLAVDVMKVSLEMEHIEPQAIACLENIAFSLRYIKNTASSSLEYEDEKEA